MATLLPNGQQQCFDYWVLLSPEDKVVGMTGLCKDVDGEKEEEGTLWLDWFALDPSCRGKRLGSMLLQFTKEQAIQRGTKRIKLYTSNQKSEHVANLLYQKLGFKKWKERTSTVLEDGATT